MNRIKYLAYLPLLILAQSALSLTVTMNTVDPQGQSKNIGSINLEAAKCGVLITPNLHGLPPGEHGFHIHEHPSCADNAMAAGGHLDPKKSEKHLGPYTTTGHQGDLPILVVDKNGNATLPTLAPNLTMAELEGHSIMIHLNGDNYSDTPEKLGGGGARIACGVINK